MEWLNYLLGGTSIVSIVLFLIFYKQNKALKQHEVEKSANEVESGEIANKSSHIQTEMDKISLGTRYLDEIIAATEKLNAYQSDYKAGIESLSGRIDEIRTDVIGIKREVNLMALFLDGAYDKFKNTITKITENNDNGLSEMAEMEQGV